MDRLDRFLSDVDSIRCEGKKLDGSMECPARYIPDLVRQHDPNILRENPKTRSGVELFKLFYAKHVDHQNVYRAGPKATELMRRIVPNENTRAVQYSKLTNMIRNRRSADGTTREGEDLANIHKENFWLVGTQAERIKRDKQQEKRTRERQATQIHINPAKTLAGLDYLEELDSKIQYVYDKAVGLLLASGVRGIELWAVSTFTQPTNKELAETIAKLRPRNPQIETPDLIKQVGISKVKDDPLRPGLGAVFGYSQKDLLAMSLTQQRALAHELMARYMDRDEGEDYKRDCVKPLLVYDSDHFIADTEWVRNALETRYHKAFILWPRHEISNLVSFGIKSALTRFITRNKLDRKFDHSHLLRAVYAAITYQRYGKGIGSTEFIRNVLCHESSQAASRYETIDLVSDGEEEEHDENEEKQQ